MRKGGQKNPNRIDMDKKELRKSMKTRNLALGSEERRLAARRIAGQVERHAAFAAADCVALFCALRDEPATEEMLARWAPHKRLAVPRVEGDDMRFFVYDRATLVPGAFGIEEPGPETCEVPPEEVDLAVVPGVAFTAGGARLGRGRGYYDRYLSQPAFRAVKIGVCYRHQLVDELPLEPHDVVMDAVVAG